MRTRLLLLSSVLAASLVPGCGDDGGGGSVDGRPVCSPMDDGNECTTDECVGGVPANTPRPGAACAGNGTCSAAGACVAPSCTDTAMNGDETGVDCGGACAPTRTCGDGVGCAVAADCTSGVCGAGLTCTAARCGDGVMQAGEMCDDGNEVDGDGCDDGASDVCRPTGCGNGAVTGTEVCDDANAINGDGCDNNCTSSGCGNGVTAGAETCDDGDAMDADGCSATCSVEDGFVCTTAVPSECSATCGDGLVVGAETCDQGGGNVSPGDGCDASCQTETGWTCTGAPSACGPLCGDGATISPETCDDSNTTALDGCGATCRLEPSEIEPNDDGVVATGASGITGNDFDGAGGIAVGHANSNGAFDVASGSTSFLAAIGVAGDEDVFAITNSGTLSQSVRFDVWSRAPGFGAGVACPDAALFDTGLHIRAAAGTSLASNDDRSASADRCSGLTFVLAPGQTVYAHVLEFGDNLALAAPGYALQVQPTPIVCGDGLQQPGLEECDDDNTTAGDGCSPTCTIEGSSEVEPNEDGLPSTGGSGITGNDFDVGGTLATSNATAQGVADVATTGRTWLAALTPAGDEDVFAVTNTGAEPIEVTVNTWDPATGLGRACPSTVDTGINVRDAAGAVLIGNDQRVSGDNCSRVVFAIPPGQNRYVHVTDFGDNGVITRYVAQITRRSIVCGDGAVSVGEACDDAPPAEAGDGCSATCTVEPNFTCAGSPSVCTPNPFTPIPVACTDMTGSTVLLASGDDEVVARAALPFAVSLYGSTMTHVSLSTNGFAGFFTSDAGTISANANNAVTVPSATVPNGYLAPFWDDLVLTGAGLRRQLTGAAGAQVLTYEWSASIFNVAGATVVVQLQIREGGPIEYHYCSAVGDAARTGGSGATIAAENETGTVGRAAGINAQIVTPGSSALRWIIP
ncbi:MAG: DUF4215 domain-containing protein [Kofleriaceae bacterium]|jgi:cysteine-rich repeat protein|nr:DUF4215 domain-containing protein [Kofleriaceae bacterium]